MKKMFAVLILMALWVSTAVGDTIDRLSDTPPVTKVVLYKHGLGYFEREGKIQGNATISLSFPEDQMKDILTSLYAVDLDRGRISSIRYETRDPLSKQLQDILIKVPEDAALSQFMVQLKGASVGVKASGETVVGRVLGIEPVTEVINNASITKGYRLVLLTGSGTIKSVDLYSISEFTLSDEKLQTDLKRLLDVSIEAKRNDRKKLIFTAVGEGARKVRIGYLTGMPVWKCTYRILLDEKKKESPSLVQGWALAENTTDEDWRDIKISFVSGNPISYVMDLYSPYHIRRNLVPIPGLQGLGVDWSKVSPPDIASDAVFNRDRYALMESRKEKLPAAPSAGVAKPVGAHARNKPAQIGASPVEAPNEDRDVEDSRSIGDILAGSLNADATAERLGNLFSYEPREKLSIPKGQAAMVSILSEQIAGKRIIYYKANFSPRPVNAFVLQNSTELTLEAGPVSFFEGSASLGEGILTNTLAPGSQAIIPYAMDVSFDIVPQEKSRRDPVFRARLVDGILTLTSAETLTNSWKIVNRGKDTSTLWLFQPKSSGYKLTKPEKPLKEVDRHYCFETVVKPGETIDFVVEEKRDVSETVQLAKCSEEQIRFYLTQPSLSKGAKTFLRDLGDLMAKKVSLQKEITELNQQSKRLSDEQARIRSNLQALTSNQPKEQELRSKWVASLATNENQLSECRAKLDEAGTQVLRMDEAVAKKVRDYRDE